jgi:hypothetical protein
MCVTVSLHRPQTNDLANVTIRAAHTKSIVDIATELQQRANKLRTGKDDDFEKSKPLMRALPTWLLAKVVKYVGRALPYGDGAFSRGTRWMLAFLG